MKIYNEVPIPLFPVPPTPILVFEKLRTWKVKRKHVSIIVVFMVYFLPTLFLSKIVTQKRKQTSATTAYVSVNGL